MERINFNSKLNNFILINEIIKISDSEIEATIEYKNNEQYLAIESLAQVSALHTRKVINYARHAFLLKINNIEFKKNKLLNGKYYVYAQLISKSNISYMYKVNIQKDNKIIAHGKILIGTTEYNKDFKQEKLKKHYKKVVSCLAKNLKIN